MEPEVKKKVIKDIKTARRLTRQARTMLNNTAEEIRKDSIDSNSAVKINKLASDLNIECDRFDDGINEFKKEQEVAGYQMSIFDMLN